MNEHTHIDGQLFELLREIRDDLRRDMARVEGKVDDGFAKMNGRVRTLEGWRWKLIGIGAALAAGIGFLERMF